MVKNNINNPGQTIINQNIEKYPKYGITEEIIGSERYSDILKDSLENIWYRQGLLSFAQYFYKKEQCENCRKYRVQCMGICPGMAFRNTGDIRTGDLGCPINFIKVL